MGERIDHIATVRALGPGEDYSHMDIVRRRLMMVLMERCSPARRRRPAAATEAAAALGGSGSLAPLLPCGWCCNGAGPPLQDGGSGGGKFVALGDLGFLSLCRLSDSRHQILGLSKTGFTRPSGLRFGRILYPED